jgi:hypothetical protein
VHNGTDPHRQNWQDRSMDDGLRRPIPGEREPGLLTRFGGRASMSGSPEPPSAPPQRGCGAGDPGTMDAVTIAERQREGGGAPGERRLEGERSRLNKLGRSLRQFLMAPRARGWRLAPKEIVPGPPTMKAKLGVK